MSNTTQSQYMGLQIPIVGVDPGPQWAFDIDACLAQIDQHDHSIGNGRQIQPSGISMTSDLPFVNNSATGVKSINFSGSTVTLNSSIFSNGVDLFYMDGNGNSIQLTTGGVIAGVTGNITGLSLPASVVWSSGSSTYYFYSNALAPANISIENLVLNNNVAIPVNTMTISPPAAMSSSTTLTLPTPQAVPGYATTNLMTMNAAGVMGTANVDGSTLQLVAGIASVKNSGVGPSQIYLRNIYVGTDSGVPGGYVTSGLNSFNTYSTTPIVATGFSCTLQCTGRAVMLVLNPLGVVGSLSTLQTTDSQAYIGYKYTTLSAVSGIQYVLGPGSTGIGAYSLSWMILQPPVGAITFDIYAWTRYGVGYIDVDNYELIAYEVY